MILVSANCSGKRTLSAGAIMFLIGSVFCTYHGRCWILSYFTVLRALVRYSVRCDLSSVGELYRQYKRNFAHGIMTGAFAIVALYGAKAGYRFVEHFLWR